MYLIPAADFRGFIERVWGRVMGEEWIELYLDSRAPILVFSGFLCHLRQTKVKCFCLVNISVIWTAALPLRGRNWWILADANLSKPVT